MKSLEDKTPSNIDVGRRLDIDCVIGSSNLYPYTLDTELIIHLTDNLSLTLTEFKI